jgi:hypothetical protein
MESLFIIYSALAVFGIGVTIVDLVGVFDHMGSDGAHSDDSDSDADSAAEADGAHETGFSEDSAEGAPAIRTPVLSTGPTLRRPAREPRLSPRRSERFAPGLLLPRAGPTGLFGLITGLSAGKSLAWSAGAGVFIAVLAKSLRALARRDLDSSLKPEEFLMEKAVVSVTIAPGSMGKVIARRYGTETELYARCRDAGLRIAKGSEVRIIDADEGCYWVEPLS